MAPHLPPAFLKPYLAEFYDMACQHLRAFPSPFVGCVAVFELEGLTLRPGDTFQHPLHDLTNPRFRASWLRAVAKDTARDPNLAACAGYEKYGLREQRWWRLAHRYLPHRVVPEWYKVEHPGLELLCRVNGWRCSELSLVGKRPELVVVAVSVDAWPAPPPPGQPRLRPPEEDLPGRWHPPGDCNWLVPPQPRPPLLPVVIPVGRQKRQVA